MIKTVKTSHTHDNSPLGRPLLVNNPSFHHFLTVLRGKASLLLPLGQKCTFGNPGGVHAGPVPVLLAQDAGMYRKLAPTEGGWEAYTGCTLLPPTQGGI